MQEIWKSIEGYEGKYEISSLGRVKSLTDKNGRMKLNVINTSRGLLIPETDEDYEKKGTLQIGKTYSVDVRLVRNPDFHRKYFAMLNCAWSLLPHLNP